MKNWKQQTGFKHLVVYNVDLEKWCEKYGLEIFTGECMTCKGKLEVNLPLIGEDGIRGLKADVCICGNLCVPFTYTSPELNELL